MKRRKKPSIDEIRQVTKGLRTVQQMLETPAEKCELCGCQEKNLRLIAGHKLCEQCYLGEIENPEHTIY